jgi:hypothetical protein
MGLHDQLFKQLIGEFYVEFLDLFFPQVREYLDESSLTFLDKEFFTDLVTGERREADLVTRAKFRGQDSFFIINLEGQGEDVRGFQERFLFYCLYLHQKYRVPVYPIVVFYGDYPAARQPHRYRMRFADLTVFEFNYRVLQLHKLNWREFVRRPNPVASALMARMNIAPKDRPFVKLECVRLMTSLKLNRARMHLISGFIDTYLNLNEEEERIFRQALAELAPEEREGIMEITTSWMREGIEIGRQEGRQEGLQEGRRTEALNLITRQLKKRLAASVLPEQPRLERLSLAQLEDLSEALFDFKDADDLTEWLARQ